MSLKSTLIASLLVQNSKVLYCHKTSLDFANSLLANSTHANVGPSWSQQQKQLTVLLALN